MIVVEIGSAFGVSSGNLKGSSKTESDKEDSMSKEIKGTKIKPEEEKKLDRTKMSVSVGGTPKEAEVEGQAMIYCRTQCPWCSIGGDPSAPPTYTFGIPAAVAGGDSGPSRPMQAICGGSRGPEPGSPRPSPISLRMAQRAVFPVFSGRGEGTERQGAYGFPPPSGRDIFSRERAW